MTYEMIRMVLGVNKQKEDDRGESEMDASGGVIGWDWWKWARTRPRRI